MITATNKLHAQIVAEALEAVVAKCGPDAEFLVAYGEFFLADGETRFTDIDGAVIFTVDFVTDEVAVVGPPEMA